MVVMVVGGLLFNLLFDLGEKEWGVLGGIAVDHVEACDDAICSSFLVILINTN
jgi:hypothetical protein